MTIREKIREGEHQQLDFKYCISDSKKIAKSLAAFANTDGGTLLLGVRDNGSIAGVESEEEYYMVESAARLYCKPEVEIELRTHRLEKKTILEVKVHKGDKIPYLAKSENGKWLAYLRKDDQNLLANRVILDVWKGKRINRNIFIKVRQPEELLFNHLREEGTITLSQFRKVAKVSIRIAQRILTNLILVGIIEYDLTEKGCNYLPSDNFDTKKQSYLNPL